MFVILAIKCIDGITAIKTVVIVCLGYILSSANIMRA